MACAIIATPGASSANSYLTVAEADTYFQERLHATEWPLLTPDDKCRMLVWATRLLDQWVVWLGRATTYGQVLAWPRWGLYTISEDVLDQNTIPLGVKQAVCELAWNLRTEDLTRNQDQFVAGLSSLTAGPVSLSFAGPGQGRMLDSERLLGPNVLGPIRRWVASVHGSGFSMVPLGRA